MRTTLREDSLDKEDLQDGQAQTDIENGRFSQSDTLNTAIDEKTTVAARREWVQTSPESPRNWPTWKKWSIILGLNFYTVIIFIASTGYVTDEAESQYGVGEEVSILGQSMFILGVAVGVGPAISCNTILASTDWSYSQCF